MKGVFPTPDTGLLFPALTFKPKSMSADTDTGHYTQSDTGHYAIFRVDTRHSDPPSWALKIGTAGFPIL